MSQTPSPDLAQFIVDEVQKQSGADNVRTLVEKKIGTLIVEAIDSAFRWGDTRKQIEEAVKASLAIDRPLDLPTHGAMIMAILRQKIDEQVNELIAAKLSAEMDEILGIAPKEVKLSELVELMRKDIDEGDRYGTCMTCLVEEVGTYSPHFAIYLDPESDKKKYECDLRLQVDQDGKIYAITCDRRDAKTAIVMGYRDPYQKLALAAYCCGSKLIIDEDHVSTGIGDF